MLMSWIAYPQVGSAQYSVTQQTARVTAFAVLLNDQPLATIAAIYGEVELVPSLLAGSAASSIRALLFFLFLGDNCRVKDSTSVAP